MKLCDYNSFFFVGIAGTGMSAIAQYLQGIGKQVAGSDRLFSPKEKMLTQEQFEQQAIACYFQDGSGITEHIDVVIVSTAIEESNIEYQKALRLGIPIVKRSEILAAISNSIKTIAVGGTSGKSTTTAMIFHLLEQTGNSPSLITGAGLSSLQKRGLPGNAWNGTGDYLVIEADESDGSIVNYTPEIGLLLNIDRDHKEFAELMNLFSTFKQNTNAQFIVNQDDKRTKTLSLNLEDDFSCTDPEAGIYATNFKQEGFQISFLVNGRPCSLPQIGKHNMENAIAAIATAKAIGIKEEDAIASLCSFEGIYRRTQLVGQTDEHIYVVDDFAHNPSEVAAAIKSCQALSDVDQVIAYFQPHGFGPLRFMHEDLAKDVASCLRPQDRFLIGDVYYAGGTVNKDISPSIVSDAINKEGKRAIFSGNKEESLKHILALTKGRTAVLVMGARDPKLDKFAQEVFQALAD